jgi:hypothetical protein
MQKAFMGAVVSLAASLAFSSMALAQTKAPAAKDPWRYYPTDVPTGDGGPAPKRDLSGTWNGPGSSPGVPRGGGGERPMLTPLAEQLMSERKTVGKFGPGATNDPVAHSCDPAGYPGNITQEGRALQIATMPDRIVILYQFEQTYRIIWTDGRALPKNVATEDRNALDPTYEGYSTGHWEDDYNFVAQTTGLDENTWGGSAPHSVSAVITERWTRVDHNTMKMTATVDDPKMVTKPFSMGTYNYKWNPNQMLNEMMCIPSNVEKYLSDQAVPAGSFPDAPAARYGSAGGGEGGNGAAGGGAAGGGGRGGRGGGGGQPQ